MNEREIIENLLKGQDSGGAAYGLIKGIGDDCAVIAKNESASWLVTMDTLVEQVHFNLGWHPPEQLAAKSIAVNISDIVAMGGEPQFVFLSLGLPEEFDSFWLDAFTKGIGETCRKYSCLLAGGDTVRTVQGVTITITAIGEAPADQVVYRSGASAGDTVWVSGKLGLAAAGLELCRSQRNTALQVLKPLVDAHLNPQPRVRLGKLLAENKIVSAMMDLSDGLATDLSHLCRESAVGALISSEKLPGNPLLFEAAELLGKNPVELMMSGGEDYELLFTANPAAEKKICQIAILAGIPVTAVGTIDNGPGVRLIQPVPGGKGNEEVDISFKGFDHFSER